MSEIGKVTASHLRRTAVIYLRQSTLAQVERNRESNAIAGPEWNKHSGFTVAAGVSGWLDPPLGRIRSRRLRNPLAMRSQLVRCPPAASTLVSGGGDVEPPEFKPEMRSQQ